MTGSPDANERRAARLVGANLEGAGVSPLGENCYSHSMQGELQSGPGRAGKSPDGGLPRRALAAGEGWIVHEIICRAGQSDRPFEERHDGFSVSAVIEGSFTYRSDAGRGLLYPGTLLL